MKKFLLVVLVLLEFKLFSQVNFMGINVEGNKTEVISKLRQKGFKLNSCGYLEGYTNNKKVILNVEDYCRKVYRIYYSEESTRDQTEIINRFNTLLKQFENDKKYVKISGDLIENVESLSYEMNVKNRVFETIFTQLPKENKNRVRFCIIRRYGGEFYIKTYYENLLNEPKDY